MKHFKSLIESIIDFEGKHTISKLNNHQIYGTDVSNDIKFIRNSNWDVSDVFQEYYMQLKRYAGKTSTGILAIDDTLIEKSTMTKHMEGLLFHYSHTKGKSTYGHCIVSSHYRLGDISIPYNFEFYLNEKEAKKLKAEFKTKVEIAQDLIQQFNPFGKERVFVTMDSWYTSEKIIETALAKGYHVIGGVKMNRVFRLSEFGSRHKLSKYVSNLKNSSFEKMTLNGEAYLVRRKEVYMNGIGLVTIVITKRVKDRSIRCVLSTDMNLSTESILKIYGYRWDIEVGYLYLKDRLGMGHYQMRRLKAIKKCCALVIIAYGLLEVLRVANNEKSIGQSRKVFSIMKKRSFVDQVIELNRRGVSKKDIYKRLKLTA
jgi:SRSO17 transposase